MRKLGTFFTKTKKNSKKVIFGKIIKKIFSPYEINAYRFSPSSCSSHNKCTIILGIII